MLKLITFVALLQISYISCQVAIYGQCGGEGWTGGRTCTPGTVCTVVNQWYHQCLPSTGTTTTTRSAATTTTTRSAGTTTTTRSAATTTQGSTSGKFPFGKFQVGRAFDGGVQDYREFDYISIWINTVSTEYGTNFNPWYQGKMIEKCLEQNKIPLFYAYVIAFEARHKIGLQDCDVDPNWNLCHEGANFIRANRALLVSRYRHQAQEIAKKLGRTKTAIFVMEPDFWQFYGDKTQKGGPLSGTYMRALFDDFVKEIKAELPNALISWDISAWIGEPGFQTWWGFFQTAQIDFVNTSGGQPYADSANIKPNELTWAFVSRTTGKKIIADCGYGIGGGPSDNCGKWTNPTNQNNRVKDGVIALTQAFPKGTVARVNV